MAYCPLCGDCYNSRADWVREVCPDCKADTGPTISDRVDRLEDDIEELRRRIP